VPKFGVNIVKSVSFRGAPQEFSNRYHYEGSDMTTAQATQLAQNVKAQEVQIHANDVSFLRFSVWLDTGNKATSEMISQGTLSGVGGFVANAAMDRERVYLIRWRAGNDSRGRPVYLRKYFHACGAISGASLSNPMLQQTAKLDATNKGNVETVGVGLQTVSDGSDAKVLTGPPGRARTGSAQCHDYLEHHQLGDMWR
jgi:hypothetical protein